MGVDFTAILDHNINVQELAFLPVLMKDKWPPPEVDLGTLRRGTQTCFAEWQWFRVTDTHSFQQELCHSGGVDVDLPHGFGLTVHKYGVEIQHVTRWANFLTNATVQSNLTQFTRWLGEILGSSVMIYLPDSLYTCSSAGDLLYDAQRVTIVAEWLAEHCGESAPTITAIYKELDDHLCKADGYYLELL